jgi:predicted nucleic acid-binding protein
LIVLDTNVLSELMRPQVDPAIGDWINRFSQGDLFITAITRAEIERGLTLLPRGKRQSNYRRCADATYKQFKGRCLPFEESAAVQFGLVQAARQRAGRPISTEDAQIASIVLVHGMSLATRNTRDFRLIENLKLINPWDWAVNPS